MKKKVFRKLRALAKENKIAKDTVKEVLEETKPKKKKSGK